MASDPLIPVFTVVEGRLIVRYQGEIWMLCGGGWGDKETEVACRSINPTWRYTSYHTDTFFGT